MNNKQTARAIMARIDLIAAMKSEWANSGFSLGECAEIERDIQIALDRAASDAEARAEAAEAEVERLRRPLIEVDERGAVDALEFPISTVHQDPKGTWVRVSRQAVGEVVAAIRAVLKEMPT